MTGSDSSGCVSMEGLLKKKNSHGVWKDRYGQLKNSYFITYKPKGKQPSSEVKETVDLREVTDISIKSDQFEISMMNGEVLIYKGAYLDLWVEAINARMMWANALKRKSEHRNGSDNLMQISGYIKKKSHNKYQGYQVLFFVGSKVYV